ncbi:MAG: hypothetical protein QOJ89_260 [bacterium]
MSTVSTQFPAALPNLPVIGFRLASDARLARLAAGGSSGAMTAIFERHHQALHRYCWSIVGNGHDAADALQNTMIKALSALPGETRDIALRPWLYRIAHNESISLLRARRPDSDLDAASHLSDVAGADAADSRERMRALSGDLSQLTERQRSALLMRELGGLEFSEVASALSTSPAAAKQSVYEARCALHALEEGRAMTCDAIRRTLSDGDRRALRGMRMRGHLHACSGCRDFEVAMRARPRQLTAIIPPLPAAAAGAILHSVLGGAGTGGGGMLAGLAGAAKATTGLSVAAKVTAAVAVTATLGGGAVYGVPLLQGGADRPVPASVAGPATRQPSGSSSAAGAQLRRVGGSSGGAAGLTPVGAAAQGLAPGAGTSGPHSAATGTSGTSQGTKGAKGAASHGSAAAGHEGAGKGAGKAGAAGRRNAAASAHGKSTAAAHAKSTPPATGRPATLPAAANSVATTKHAASPPEVAGAKAQQAAGGLRAAPSSGSPDPAAPRQVADGSTAPATSAAPGAARDRP